VSIHGAIFSDNNVVRNMAYEYNSITELYITISAVKCINISFVLRQFGDNAQCMYLYG